MTNQKTKNILITGVAGFIGFHLCEILVKEFQVYGIDNLNDYYDTVLKKDRLKKLKKYDHFKFIKLDLNRDHSRLMMLLYNNHFDIIIHLAAQAGVRYSIENPHAYIQSNISGSVNLF